MDYVVGEYQKNLGFTESSQNDFKPDAPNQAKDSLPGNPSKPRRSNITPPSCVVRLLAGFLVGLLVKHPAQGDVLQRTKGHAGRDGPTVAPQSLYAPGVERQPAYRATR